MTSFSLFFAPGALATLLCCGKAPLDAVELNPGSIGTGLVAHYTFDEGAGTVLVDHSRNKRDGAMVGGQWLQDGAFGGAIHFTGTATDYAVADFPNASESYSVSVWTRARFTAQDEDAETLLSTENPFVGGWELNLNRFRDGIGVHAGFWDTVTMTYVLSECVCVPEARWTHLAFVHDATENTLTVLDDVAIYSRALVPEEIVELGCRPAPDEP